MAGVFECPKCGSKQTVNTNTTRPRKMFGVKLDGPVVRRYKKCEKCGVGFMTCEMAADSLDFWLLKAIKGVHREYLKRKK